MTQSSNPQLILRMKIAVINFFESPFASKKENLQIMKMKKSVYTITNRGSNTYRLLLNNQLREHYDFSNIRIQKLLKTQKNIFHKWPVLPTFTTR